MTELNIIEHSLYSPMLSHDYDLLFASLHGDPHFRHDRSELEAVYSAPNSHLFLGFIGIRAAAMATLVGPDISYGKNVFGIEDVATQSGYEHNGYGGQMLDFTISRAIELGATRIVLTSKPKREAARKMYINRGFKEATDTSLFRKEIA